MLATLMDIVVRTTVYYHNAVPTMPPRQTGAWTLKFRLTEYTPGEVEKMTTLSTAMQRDWRSRGYLQKSDKHARFDAFSVIETWVMKMYSDQGKGPALSYSHAPRIALGVLQYALLSRRDAWGERAPEDVFDQLPADTRGMTAGEEYDIHERARVKSSHERLQDRLLDRDPDEPRKPYSPSKDEKRQWIVERLFRSLGVSGSVPRGGQAIWWPTNEVSFDHYESVLEQINTTDGHLLDRFDPRFDGAALVLDFGSIAANLARRAPRPLVAVDVVLNSDYQPSSPHLHGDRGHVQVEAGSRS